MKKLLITVFLFVSWFQLTFATEYVMPEQTEALKWMQTRSEKQWYKIPVVRYYLHKAFNNPKYTAEQKQYIWSLMMAIEDVSEQHFRVSPWYETRFQGKLARLYGQIDDTIDEKTRELIDNNPDLHTIELVYVPGSDHDIDNHKAWRMIRDAWIKTRIKEFWFIASGGTDLLMAWTKRTIADGAFIGVHAWTSPSVPASWSLSTSHSAHAEYLNYFADMGISTDLYWWILENTRPTNIHWMTSGDLDTYWF